MSKKLQQLAQRRAYLIQQVESQRDAMSQEAEPWRAVLATADEGIAAVRYLKDHPMWLVGASGVILAVIGPGRALKLVSRGWFVLQLVMRMRIR